MTAFFIPPKSSLIHMAASVGALAGLIKSTKQYSASQPQCEGVMRHARGTNPRTKRGEWYATTNECQDWLADYFRAYSAKEIAEKTGIGVRGSEGVKSGRHGLSMAHLSSICRNDPEFRLHFFRFCGGYVEGEPELVTAISHAINEIVRRKPSGDGDGAA